MSDDQLAYMIEAVTEGVYEKLKNGPLARIEDRLGSVEDRLGSVEDRLGSVEEIVAANSSKIDDLHGWMVTLNHRVADMEADRR